MSRTNIELLDREIAALKRDREETLLIMQEECDHPVEEWLETPHKPQGYITYASGPIRVCKLCGYAEEGWGCGFWKLEDYDLDIPQIKRDTAHQNFILKLYTQRDLNAIRFKKDKVLVAPNETSVARGTN